MARRDDSAPDDTDFGFGNDSGEPVDPATLIGDSGNNDDGNGPGDGRDYDDRTFDPERHISRDRLNADGTFRRKRKSGKRGPNARTRSASSPSLDLGVLTGILLSVHAGVAGLTSIPEIALAEDEAKELAKATIALEKAFPTNIDPRIFAVMNMVGISAAIYGPRIFAARMRMAEQKKAGEGPPKSEVVNFRTVQQTNEFPPFSGSHN